MRVRVCLYQLLYNVRLTFKDCMCMGDNFHTRLLLFHAWGYVTFLCSAGCL